MVIWWRIWSGSWRIASNWSTSPQPTEFGRFKVWMARGIPLRCFPLLWDLVITQLCAFIPSPNLLALYLYRRPVSGDDYTRWSFREDPTISASAVGCCDNRWDSQSQKKAAARSFVLYLIVLRRWSSPNLSQGLVSGSVIGWCFKLYLTWFQCSFWFGRYLLCALGLS